MRRLILYFLAIFVLGLIAAWLAENRGTVAIDWLGWRIETSLAVLVVLAALVAAALLALTRAWLWLRRDGPLSPRERELRRQRAGLVALNDAMVALAAGDAKRADRLADRAERLLPPQPLTHVVTAEAARLSGDDARAAARYRQMLEDGTAKFIGLRGLIAQALTGDRRREALRLVREAQALEPKSDWIIETRFALEAAVGHWKEAAATLASGEKLGIFAKPEAARHRAALAYAEALEADLAQDAAKAAQLAEAALKARPGFAPAAELAARLAKAAGQNRKAARILEKAWAERPHPLLAGAYQALEPLETPRQRYRRVKKLCDMAPDAAESRLFLARAAVRAEHEDEVPALLAPLAEQPGADRETLGLMADAALSRGDDADAAAWSQKAERAPARPAWVCASCGARPAAYAVACPVCGDFDSLDAPGEGTVPGEAAGRRAATPVTLLPSPLSSPDARLRAAAPDDSLPE